MNTGTRTVTAMDWCFFSFLGTTLFGYRHHRNRGRDFRGGVGVGVPCYAAVSGGHLEILQWARANGCPWDINTFGDTRAKAYLEMKNWAKANGWPPDKY